MDNGRYARLLIIGLLVALSGLALVGTLQVGAKGAGLETAVLYDGALGTLPEAQSFTYLAIPSGPTPTITDGGVILDSTPTGSDSAGYFNRVEETPTLDRGTGYTVTVQARLLTETHASPDRAGFSLIVLSDDQGGAEPVRGIELGFWQNEVWAQDDDQEGGTLFTHAEGAALTTTAEVIDYDLRVMSETYTLLAGGEAVLNGRLRNYENFSGPIDPYETPNFIFLGDNTSSAAARVQINHVAVSYPAPPVEEEIRIYLPLVERP
jgi:hypothetical protein